MRKVIEKLAFIFIGILILVTMLYLSCPAYSKDTQTTEINVWRKVSTDEMNPGEIVSLDMSKGYASCEDPFVYIIVRIVESEEEVIIAFPNGGYWTAPEPDPFLQELQQEFDSLEDYLRKLESEEIKKK